MGRVGRASDTFRMDQEPGTKDGPRTKAEGRRPDAAQRSAYHYRADVLSELERHGVRPTPRTPPELVHEFVSDLYRFELRVLRRRLLHHEFPKASYIDRVVQLRKKYPVISQKPWQWVEEEEQAHGTKNEDSL